MMAPTPDSASARIANLSRGEDALHAFIEKTWPGAGAASFPDAAPIVGLPDRVAWRTFVSGFLGAFAAGVANRAPRSISYERAVEINRLDLPHRKGWRPSEVASPLDTLRHLRHELDELEDALNTLGGIGLGDPDVVARISPAEAIAHAREELADAYGCVMQLAIDLSATFADVDAEADRKLQIRFDGADAIETLA